MLPKSLDHFASPATLGSSPHADACIVGRTGVRAGPTVEKSRKPDRGCESCVASLGNCEYDAGVCAERHHTRRHGCQRPHREQGDRKR